MNVVKVIFNVIANLNCEKNWILIIIKLSMVLINHETHDKEWYNTLGINVFHSSNYVAWNENEENFNSWIWEMGWPYFENLRKTKGKKCSMNEI